MNNFINLKNVSKIYFKKNKIKALNKINLNFELGKTYSIIGPSGSYQSIPDIGKLILCAGMILGRLEIFAILVMFSPLFWKN